MRSRFPGDAVDSRLPCPVANFAAEAFPHALERLGLDRLVPLLDQSRRWDRILSDVEQQSLAFARAVIHAPHWLLIDQVSTPPLTPF